MSADVSEYEIGPLRKGEEVALLETFRRVFGQAKSLEYWRWQFEANPCGQHAWVARTAAGQVISQFAALPRRLKVRDDVFLFGEVVDSMTDPEFRAGLKKPGLFASTCNAFVDEYGRPDREAIMYGLPNPPAFRIGRKLLGYVHLYDVELMTREIAAAEVAPRLQERTISRLGAEHDELWSRVAHQHMVSVIKDAQYLNWRYADCPSPIYQLREYRDDVGLIVGLAVFRPQWIREGYGAIADVIADSAHPLAPTLADSLQASGTGLGVQGLQAFVRPSSPFAHGLGARGVIPVPSHFRFVARTYEATVLPLDWLKDAWDIALGDFDVV